MKKFITVFMLTVCVALSGILFAACNKVDKITSVYLQFESENEAIDFFQKSSGDKTIEYDLSAEYGVEISADEFTIWKTINNSNTSEVKQKTDASAGYTLESDLPSSPVPNAGEYTLTFTYEGWTNKVNVKIDKKKVRLPYLEAGSEVEYDGQDYTKRIIYDKTAATMLDDSERILPIDAYDETSYYHVEFSLKNTNNYCWEDSQFGSGNFTFDFSIYKKQMRVDIPQYFKVNTADEHYEAGDPPTLRYDSRENYPKNLEDVLALSALTFDNTQISQFKDFVELKLVAEPYGLPVDVSEITAGTSCYLVLAVKDSSCYAIGTITQTTQLTDFTRLLTIVVS